MPIAISNARRNFAYNYHKIKKETLLLYPNRFIYKIDTGYFAERMFDRLRIANSRGL